MLILKAHPACTYRRPEELLILMPPAREAIGLLETPRFTMLAAFAGRADVLELIDSVLASIARAISKARPQDAAGARGWRRPSPAPTL